MHALACDVTSFLASSFAEIDSGRCHLQVSKWDAQPEVIGMFNEVWSVLDDGSGSITVRQLRWLLQQLPRPVGLGYHASREDCKRRLLRMLLLRTADDRLPYHLTLYESLRVPLEVPLPSGVPVVNEHQLRTMLFLKAHQPTEAGLTRALAEVFDLSLNVRSLRQMSRASTEFRTTEVSLPRFAHLLLSAVS